MGTNSTAKMLEEETVYAHSAGKLCVALEYSHNVVLAGETALGSRASVTVTDILALSGALMVASEFRAGGMQAYSAPASGLVVELRMGHITVRSPRVTGPDVVFVVDNVTAVREGLSICRSFRDSREAIAETERKSDLRAAGLGACA